ncbi:MAG TPA: PIN domain-containing protein [Candidatus Saccharimonadales bacterium]
MSGSLDTSVLVQLVTGQTPELAAEAVRLVEQADAQLAIADAAVIELIFVLEKLKRLDRKDIMTAVEVLSGHKIFNFNRALFAEALPQYVAQPALSIHDCCLAVYAKFNNAEPLWTFDQKLAKQMPGARLVPIAK